MILNFFILFFYLKNIYFILLRIYLILILSFILNLLKFNFFNYLKHYNYLNKIIFVYFHKNNYFYFNILKIKF